MSPYSYVAPLDAQEVIDHMLDAFALHEILLDDSGRPVDYIFLALNSSFEKMTGIKGETAIGRRVTELMPDIEAFWIEQYGHVALTGESIHFRNYDHVLHKWWEVVAFCPRKNRFAVTFRDVTQETDDAAARIVYAQLTGQLYQLSKASWKSESDLFVAALQKAVEAVDGEFACIHMLGHDEASVENTYISDPGLESWFHHPEPEGQCYLESLWSEVLQTRNYLIINEEKRTPGKFIRKAIVPVLDNDRIVFLAGMSSENRRFTGVDAEALKTYFTELWQLVKQLRLEEEKKALQDQFLQAQRLESLGMQAGIIAHDFNNLLAAILGKVNLALVKAKPAEDTGRELEGIRDLVRQGKDLTNQLLAFAGKDSLELEYLDMRALLKSFEPLVRSTVPRNVKVEYHVEDEGLTSKGDEGRLRQVLMNLVVNAAGAIGASSPGNICIRIRRRTMAAGDFPLGPLKPPPPGEYVCLEVEDNGPGMTPETMGNLFQPFFTTKSTGHGIGLAAVMGIVKEHGGSIQVQSHVGIGTLFQIYLPRVEDQREVSDGGAGSQQECQDVYRPLSILLVDDDPYLRDVNKETLECLGHRVTTAAGGGAALQLLGEDTYDLMLLDLTMPDMSGQEVWKKTREEQALLPIVILTGYSAELIPEHMLEDPHTRFLQKPFELSVLLDRISTLV